MEQISTKFNWKVAVALVILVVSIFWGFDSLRTRSYSGTELKFPIGTGPVTVTNSSDEAQSVQLIGTGSQSFSMSSTLDGTSGSSVKQGTGRNADQIFDFTIPSGVSDFSVIRGTDVNFVSTTTSPLEASVQPQSADDAKGTLLIAGIIVLICLFYLSHVNDHNWISPSRRQKALDQAAAQEANNKTFKRMFGR